METVECRQTLDGLIAPQYGCFCIMVLSNGIGSEFGCWAQKVFAGKAMLRLEVSDDVMVNAKEKAAPPLRHSRAGGNPSLGFGLFEIQLLHPAWIPRLRGNSGGRQPFLIRLVLILLIYDIVSK